MICPLQVERFNSLYSVSGALILEDSLTVDDDAKTPTATMFASPGGSLVDLTSSFIDFDSTVDVTNEVSQTNNSSKRRIILKTRGSAYQKDREDRVSEKSEQRDSESYAALQAQEHAEKEASREERRRQKLEIRIERDHFARQQKEAAMRRAAELVASNRVPIEITRGAAAAKAAEAKIKAGSKTVANSKSEEEPVKKRSAIVVSTANDLNQIVTHAKNLFAKYSAIAREHNQRVSWTTIARELGIHVKVRQKYSRMHTRAEQRKFDWQRNGHWKIKDHPEIFLEPTEAEKRAKMPLPPPDEANTVMVDETNKEIDFRESNDTHNVDNSVSNTASSADEDYSSDERDSDDQNSTVVQDPGMAFSV